MFKAVAALALAAFVFDVFAAYGLIGAGLAALSVVGATKVLWKFM